MTVVPAYRLTPDEMTAAAESIGCKLWTPYVGRDFTWAAHPGVIVITNNATETRWWQALAGQASAFCCILGRLQWKSTVQGQTALYFGTDVEVFKAAFAPFGITFKRAGRAAP